MTQSVMNGHTGVGPAYLLWCQYFSHQSLICCNLGSELAANGHVLLEVLKRGA